MTMKLSAAELEKANKVAFIVSEPSYINNITFEKQKDNGNETIY